jgi:hypothetical protein
MSKRITPQEPKSPFANALLVTAYGTAAAAILTAAHPIIKTLVDLWR